jgi:hypothetical protein
MAEKYSQYVIERRCHNVWCKRYCTFD